MKTDLRKRNNSIGAFIIGGSYLAGALVNLVFFHKAVGAILTVMGAANVLIGLAIRKKESAKDK